jgi:hypothetical protein
MFDIDRHNEENTTPISGKRAALYMAKAGLEVLLSFMSTALVIAMADTLYFGKGGLSYRGVQRAAACACVCVLRAAEPRSQGAA